MSILPNHTQGSTSSTSSSSLPLYPNSQQHGTTIRDLLQSPSPSPSAPSLSPQVESLQISDSQSPIAMLHYNSVSLASAEKDFGGSSKKVNDNGTPNDTKTLPYQSSDTDSQCHSGGRGVGSAQVMGRMSGTIISPRTERSMVSLNSHGSNMHSSGRKAQFMNGNHLLNFHYDPISRPQHQPRAPPPRRQQKTKPYNKDLFLQANYKFVVLDSGNYTPESMDPDKMLRWEDIICVMYSTPFPVQCPICLEYPLCPQITSCGHIFCFPCILQYLLMGEEDHKGDSWKRCPLCFVMISPKDLYTIYIENVKQHCVGDTTEFVLLTRQKDSVSLLHKSKQETDIMLCHNHEICDPFSKFTFTSDVDLSVRKAISDLDSWLVRADSGFVDELEKLPYVCAAMEQLEQRKKYWNEHWAGESHRSNKITDFQAESHVLVSTACATRTDNDESSFRFGTVSTHVNDKIKWPGNSILGESNGGARLDNQTADQRELLEGQDVSLSSSYGESQSRQRLSNETRDAKDKNSYNFYQAADGQHLILHPLNMSEKVPMGSEKNQETPEVSNTKESSEKTEGPPDQVATDHSKQDGQGKITTSSGLKVRGFKNEMISLEKMLKRRQSEDEFKAIGIVGELGVGKSTLCRALLNKNEVKTSFLPRIWVRMSKKSAAENSEEAVVKRMLECLGVDEEIIKSICVDNGRTLDDKERLNALLYALHLQLNGKKYLIVLDDVYKEDEWYRDLSAEINRSYDWNERLAYGLPKGNGGTVIVTSRNKEVAKNMVGKEENIHHLLPLWKQESCWSIFTDTVEREKQVLNFLDQGDLEKAKRDLFEKCGGLPLAAKMMGKTMAEKLKDEAANKPQVPVAERSETEPQVHVTEPQVPVAERSETEPQVHVTEPQVPVAEGSETEPQVHVTERSETEPQVPVAEGSKTEPQVHVAERSETEPQVHVAERSETEPQVPVAERSETHDEASGEGTDHVGDLQTSETHDDGASGKSQDVGRVAQESTSTKV